jgi:hypothetical protein
VGRPPVELEPAAEELPSDLAEFGYTVGAAKRNMPDMVRPWDIVAGPRAERTALVAAGGDYLVPSIAVRGKTLALPCQVGSDELEELEVRMVPLFVSCAAPQAVGQTTTMM